MVYDKVAFYQETNETKVENFTQEEKEFIEKQNQNRLLNPKIITEPIDSEKVAIAEAMIDLTIQVENLKTQINKLTGGK